MSNPNKPDMKRARPGIPVAYAHAKLDGHFLRVQRHGGGDVIATTSNPTDITMQLPDELYVQCERLPPGTVALGELWVPGRPASCVKTAIKEQWPDLAITFFALEILPGRGQLELERMPLEEAHMLFDSWELNFAPFELLAEPGRTRALGEQEIEHLKSRARMAGLEGWVLKVGNMQGWYKLKCENSIDAVITGVKDGHGKYTGQVGSLLCSVHRGLDLVEIAAVSGMTDTDRLDITEKYDEDPNSILGRVIEIEYQRVDSKGRLRHPRFERFREDKQAVHCTHDQDPDLEKYLR